MTLLCKQTFWHLCMWYVLSCFSRVQIFATLWTIARQAPLSVGFSRQEYWSGLPFPSPGDLPDPRNLPNSGIKPMSPALAGQILYHWAAWEVVFKCMRLKGVTWAGGEWRWGREEVWVWNLAESSRILQDSLPLSSVVRDDTEDYKTWRVKYGNPGSDTE